MVQGFIKLKDCFFHIFFICEEVCLSLIDVMKEVVECFFYYEG
jgi:hypothetical protein